jgi:hypothetical protein
MLLAGRNCGHIPSGFGSRSRRYNLDLFDKVGGGGRA